MEEGAKHHMQTCLIKPWGEAVGEGGSGRHLEIHSSAQSAFLATQGMVSTARKRWSFSTGSLMYVSSRRLYISAPQR